MAAPSSDPEAPPPDSAPEVATVPPARVVSKTAWIRDLPRPLAVAAGVGLLVWGWTLIDLDRHWVTVLGQIAIAIGGATVVALQPGPRRWIARVGIQQWRAIDAETDRSTPAPDPHIRFLVVAVTCAVSLTIQEYVGGADRYEVWFTYDGGDYWELKGFVWWTAWRVIGYVLIPIIAIICMPGERIRDYHLSGRGFFKHLWIYAVMFLVLLPVVIAASTSPSFRETYPFYRMANRSQFDLWSWESMYVVQFMALEFFFRGFLLNSLRRVMGSNAIFVMIVPYCMIHYGKPMPETLGAIGAGLILGTLAMRTKSIWGGVLIHVGVATTMDVLALRGCPEFGSGKYCH